MVQYSSTMMASLIATNLITLHSFALIVIDLFTSNYLIIYLSIYLFVCLFVVVLATFHHPSPCFAFLKI